MSVPAPDGHVVVQINQVGHGNSRFHRIIEGPAISHDPQQMTSDRPNSPRPKGHVSEDPKA